MPNRAHLASRCLLTTALLTSACRAAAPTPAVPPSRDDAAPEVHPWWQDAVFYEIYPRSFADSNGDGIGDLAGITSKLDYLKEVGIDAIWITPCYPSPQVDFGYDVSDYENIDPMYGTLKDFDVLAAEAKRRGIRIVMDLVMNHTSDRHEWFVDSRRSRASAHRDWYVWRDGKGGQPPKPPNNWVATFGGSAWQFDPTTGQYYYHFFYPEQPDLNWRNPLVKQAMLDVSRWWYRRGVSGFRLDAVDTLFEDPDLRDNEVLPGKNALGDPKTRNEHNTKLPEVHEVLRELRKVADQYGAVLVGETWTSDIDELKRYYGAHGDEVELPMNFMFATVNERSASAFRKQIASAESVGGWPTYVIGNHDIVRSYVRYGDGQHDDAIGKLMAALYLTLRGTPVLYYGEEIGMENNDPTRPEDVRDPIGKLGWPKEKGRDGERTPMQWTDGANAGFSEAKPWLPVPPSFRTHNVATESTDPQSVLQFYKRVLALRHQRRALREGQYVALDEDDRNVLAYLRQSSSDTVLVALNMSGQEQRVRFDLTPYGLAAAKATTLLSTRSVQPTNVAVGSMTLEPFEAYVAAIAR